MKTDSESTLAILRTPEEQHSMRNKHLDVKKCFITDRIARGFITAEHVRTEEQLADMLTKSLSADKVKRFCVALQIRA